MEHGRPDAILRRSGSRRSPAAPIGEHGRRQCLPVNVPSRDRRGATRRVPDCPSRGACGPRRGAAPTRRTSPRTRIRRRRWFVAPPPRRDPGHRGRWDPRSRTVPRRRASPDCGAVSDPNGRRPARSGTGSRRRRAGPAPAPRVQRGRLRGWNSATSAQSVGDRPSRLTRHSVTPVRVPTEAT